MCLHFSMQEEDILEVLLPSVICVHFSLLVDHLYRIGIHRITLWTYSCQDVSNRSWTPVCDGVKLMMKLLIISVTYRMPQNKVSDTIMHVTLNTINGVAQNKIITHNFFSRNTTNVAHPKFFCYNFNMGWKLIWPTWISLWDQCGF